MFKLVCDLYRWKLLSISEIALKKESKADSLSICASKSYDKNGIFMDFMF
jgi:hypothetical protein